MTARDNGWFRLYRAFFTSDLWEEERELSRAEAFLYLLAFAEWKDKHRLVRGRRVLVPRGSLVRSVRQLMRAWRWNSPGRVVRFLDEQVNAERIARDSKTGQITIYNYELYQGSQNGDGTATEQPRNSHGTRSEEGKKLEGKKTPTPTLPPVAVGLDSIPEALRTPPIEAAVREYVVYRGKLRYKPLPAEGWTKLWNRLDGLSPAEVVACFDRCMGSGNQGVFPPARPARAEAEGGSSRYRRLG